MTFAGVVGDNSAKRTVHSHGANLTFIMANAIIYRLRV